MQCNALTRYLSLHTFVLLTACHRLAGADYGLPLHSLRHSPHRPHSTATPVSHNAAKRLVQADELERHVWGHVEPAELSLWGWQWREHAGSIAWQAGAA